MFRPLLANPLNTEALRWPMQDSESPVGIESEHLADVMKALANPVRIDLLKALRQAKTLGEIRLRPRRGGSSDGLERIMSRVTVKQHLDQLMAIGVVQTRSIVRDGRPLDHYIVDHRQLFALTEELRQMARLRPQGEMLDGTQPAPAANPMAQPGAKLALVNGTYEGRVFPLPAVGRSSRWSIGRRANSSVCLDYDPYVSLQNSEVVCTGGVYTIVDLPQSRNGTMVNWVTLPKGVPQRLESGDVIGVGRSTMVFRLS